VTVTLVNGQLTFVLTLSYLTSFFFFSYCPTKVTHQSRNWWGIRQ